VTKHASAYLDFELRGFNHTIVWDSQRTLKNACDALCNNTRCSSSAFSDICLEMKTEDTHH